MVRRKRGVSRRLHFSMESQLSEMNIADNFDWMKRNF
jgi:hypothetical protein